MLTLIFIINWPILDPTFDAAKAQQKLAIRRRFVLKTYLSALKNRLKAEMIYVEEKRLSSELNDRPLAKDVTQRELDALTTNYRQQKERVKAAFDGDVPEVRTAVIFLQIFNFYEMQIFFIFDEIFRKNLKITPKISGYFSNFYTFF